jgi:hypothetical protein
MFFIRSFIAVAFLAISLLANGNTPDLQKCGEARLTVLFWDIYESSLFTPSGEYYPDIRPLRLEIRYLRAIKAKDLVAQTAKEWQAQGIEDSRHAQWLSVLTELWPDVSQNDVLALAIADNGRAEFSFNGQFVGAIEDPDFGRDFTGIWLSPNTTRPQLRAALIGDAGRG